MMLRLNLLFFLTLIGTANAQCDRDLFACPSGDFVGRVPPACEFPPCNQVEPYMMYVQKLGYHPEYTDSSGNPCGDAQHLNSQSAQPTCWSHNWEGWPARQDLWSSTTRTDRKIDLLLVSATKERLETLHNSSWPRNAANRCDDELHWLLKTNHCHGTRVYALFADSDEHFSERKRIPLVDWYNGNCSDGIAAHQFDGVAVNNEKFSDKRCDYYSGANSTSEIIWLDQLYDAKQLAGSLSLHLSVGWTWSRCPVGPGPHFDNLLPWAPPGDPPVIKKSLHHMYDIVDSVDVQVAHTAPTTITSRLDTADYAYHATSYPANDFYSLAFTNNDGSNPCIVSHFFEYPPASSSCAKPSGEEGVFFAFQEVETVKPHAKGGLHTFRKSYDTGIALDWPHVPFVSSFQYFLCLLSSITYVDVAKKRARLDRWHGQLTRKLRRVEQLAAKQRLDKACRVLASADSDANKLFSLATRFQVHDLQALEQVCGGGVLLKLYHQLCQVE